MPEKYSNFIALEQLQIAPSLLNELFAAIVGAVTLAAALAFGLGGRETAHRLLSRGENTVNDAASQIQAQQKINQLNDSLQEPVDQRRTRQQAQAEFRRKR